MKRNVRSGLGARTVSPNVTARPARIERSRVSSAGGAAAIGVPTT